MKTVKTFLSAVILGASAYAAPHVRYAGGNLQQALDAGAGGRVTIAGGVWEVDPGFVKNGTEVVFEDGAELVANPGGFFGKNDCVLTVQAQTNVTIRGGTIRMHRADYLAKKDGRVRSQWRHCVNLRGAVGVRVENMRFFESGGDGVYVANDGASPCRNIEVLDCFCDRPLRQSMSVIDVIGLRIENCTFQRALGENPQAGIDFEPNNARQRLQGIVMRNCRFAGNARKGINLHLSPLDGTSPPVDFLIENCISVSNMTAFGICMNGREHFVKGRIVVSNCLFAASLEQGMDISQKPLEAASLKFHDVTVTDSCSKTPHRGDIQMLTRNFWDPPLDGILFDRVTVRQTRKGPWIAADNATCRKAPPQCILGSVKVERADGTEEFVALGERWAASALPPAAGEEIVPMPAPEWDAFVPDAVSGMVRYRRLMMRGWLHYPFYADGAGEISFIGGLRRTERKDDRIAHVTVRKVGEWDRPLAKIKAVELDKGSFSFDAPDRGWYVLTVNPGRNSFSLTGCDAPVFLSLSHGGRREFVPDSMIVALPPIASVNIKTERK